ncbi:hypothetical protein OZX60_04300 [Streptococcaceae bacterium ESL0687]|nr:hypothetical protein OZX60_04300 [Streptococcaceae bacterium ESL0687]
MTNARLMNRPEDFKRFGINPEKVEPWEDGIRNSDDIGNNEVWYFDANLDDGSKVVVAFRTKTVDGMYKKGFTPNFNLDITRPDGRTTQEFGFATIEESSMSKEKCDVHFGDSYCTGDFKNYTIHIKTETLACDLHYKALTVPFRHGTSAIALGDEDEYFYTDLSVPKCQVTGSLTYDGKEVEVEGQGYHDHQWMNITPLNAFHHWFWGRMYTEKYVVYIYDFVASPKYDYKRITYFMVADNETGELVFETNGNVELETDLEEMSVGKKYPKTSRYKFDNGSDKAEFTVTWEQILETRDIYGAAPKDAEEAVARAKKAGLTNIERVMGGTKEAFDQLGIMPSYMRFFAEGDIKLTLNGKQTESSGDMIYEYNYPGTEDEKAGV